MNLFVYYPLLGKTYEFLDDEEKTVGEFIEEATEIICEKEKMDPPEDFGQLICANRRTKRIIARQQTLVQAGLREGDEVEII